MNRQARSTLALGLGLLGMLAFSASARAQWTAPTEEELKMTAQPEVPGAAAVYLFCEEITEDQIHMWSKYVRLKVLTEAGKEYANVELRQYSTSDNGGYTVGDIQGRTIHADGTIIPFTGKPFDKLIEKGQGFKAMAKVFTLPDVEIGSIIEYRYKLRYDDNYYFAPSWYIQSELYMRKAHYLWKPTDRQLVSKNERGEQLTSAILWYQSLPKGVAVKQARAPSAMAPQGQATLELEVHDIPPMPREEHMPPIASRSERVLFYYSPYTSPEEYWKNEGKGWSKARDKFIGPGPAVRAAVKEFMAPGDTQSQTLGKLYAAVMKLDNSAFDRQHSAAEEKSQGLGEIKTSDNILERKRGSADEITELFVAMARAAGMKAYVMAVTDRDRDLFQANYLSFSQLDGLVAIVNVDGKDQFFDPGQRYCPFGHLAWQHSMTGGLRQIDGGTKIEVTAPEPYTASQTKRVADLLLDEHGEVSGIVTLTWSGAPGLRWRQASLRGDNTSLERDLRTALENMLPGGAEVKVTGISNVEEYEKPLVANYAIKTPIASSAGRRMLVPGDIFVMSDKPAFPHEKRELPVYFDYPHMVMDAVRIKFPNGLGVESLPAAEKTLFQKYAFYELTSETTPASFTVRRTFALGEILFTPAEYPDLRSFYSKLETKDQEPVVLKAAAPPPSGN